jgi:hypothetical protein
MGSLNNQMKKKSKLNNIEFIIGSELRIKIGDYYQKGILLDFSKSEV